jgi:hypothetical protein
MRSRFLRRPSPALIVALIALFVSLGGTSYAALSLPRNSVGTAQLKNRAVTKKKISKKTIASLRGERGPQGPQGPQGATGARGATGAQGLPGVANVYRSTLAISLPASGDVRLNPLCNPGDFATGGGYFLNSATLTDAQRDVEVFSNGPDTDLNVQNPPGWDIGIHNKTTTARTGFAYAVCVQLNH